MFKLKKTMRPALSLACCLSEKGYSLAAVKNNKQLLFCESREFIEKTSDFIAQTLADDVDRLKLVGHRCQVILAHGLYQLLLMDAVDVPEEELAKALRWRLKGLSDYPVNDIAVDAFLMPPHGVAGQRKKVFVGITPLSLLKTRLWMLESAFLDVSSVDIAEIALKNILTLTPIAVKETPVIVISLDDTRCHLQIFFQDNLYLSRALALSSGAIDGEGTEAQAILLEIQRSIDYCLSEFRLPEPQDIVFTPGFYRSEGLFDFLRQELAKEVILLDLNQYLDMQPRMEFKEQNDAFYSIGGALTFDETKAQGAVK